MVETVFGVRNSLWTLHETDLETKLTGRKTRSYLEIELGTNFFRSLKVDLHLTLTMVAQVLHDRPK